MKFAYPVSLQITTSTGLLTFPCETIKFLRELEWRILDQDTNSYGLSRTVSGNETILFKQIEEGSSRNWSTEEN